MRYILDEGVQFESHSMATWQMEGRSLTLEILLTAIGEKAEDEDKNKATTIATFEKIVAMFTGC